MVVLLVKATVAVAVAVLVVVVLVVLLVVVVMVVAAAVVMLLLMAALMTSQMTILPVQRQALNGLTYRWSHLVAPIASLSVVARSRSWTLIVVVSTQYAKHIQYFTSCECHAEETPIQHPVIEAAVCEHTCLLT